MGPKGIIHYYITGGERGEDRKIEKLSLVRGLSYDWSLTKIEQKGITIYWNIFQLSPLFRYTFSFLSKNKPVIRIFEIIDIKS